MLMHKFYEFTKQVEHQNIEVFFFSSFYFNGGLATILDLYAS